MRKLNFRLLNIICYRIPPRTARVYQTSTQSRIREENQIIYLNHLAGCRITTIQPVLGHRELSATLVYARVHDRTVAENYYAAMAVIEERLAAHLNRKPEQQSHTNGHHPGVNGNAVKLLRLVSALQAEPLTEEQQAVVTELQQELLSLAA